MTSVFKLFCWLCLAHNSFALKVFDDQGQALQLEQAPSRIVSYTLASDEMLLALAKPEQIAALSPLAQNPRYSYISEAAKAYPQIHDVEQIISLKADLVILASYNQAEIRHFLDKAQIPSFYLSRFENLSDIETHITQIGALLARPTQAQNLIQQFRSSLAQSKAALNCKLPALLSYDQWGYVAGRETIFQALLDYLGVENVAKTIEGYQRLQLEWVYQQQPEIIIIPSEPSAFVQARNKISQHPLLKHSPAVKKQRLLTLNQRDLNSVSQHLATGMHVLVNALKPYCQ